MILVNVKDDLAVFNLDILIIFILGTCIGSFLSLVAYRLPQNKSIIFGRSHCESCNSTLSWGELIPLISYIIQRAKCKTCGFNLPFKYILTELICGLIFVMLYKNFGLSFEFLKFTLLSSFLIVLSIIDFNYKAVPDTLLLLIIIITLIPTVNLSFLDLLQTFLLFSGAFFIIDFMVTFYIQNIKSKITKNIDLLNQKALGEGDIPIAGMIGAILGIKLGIIAIFIGAIIAIIPSLYFNIKKQEAELPFIPFLSIGFILTLIFGTYL